MSSSLPNMVSLSIRFIFIAAAAAVVAAVFVHAVEEFKVGGDLGWQEPSDNNTAFYSHWAATNRFQVGDSLLFEYKNDSVLETNKYDYYHCNSNKPISTFRNGKTIISLDRPGSFYFISGASNRCKNGQRVFVNVMSPHPISQSPPESTASPSPAPLSSSSSGVCFSVTIGLVFGCVFVTSTGLGLFAI